MSDRRKRLNIRTDERPIARLRLLAARWDTSLSRAAERAIDLAADAERIPRVPPPPRTRATA